MKRIGRHNTIIPSNTALPTSMSRQRRCTKTADAAKASTNQSKSTQKCTTVRCFGYHIPPVPKSKDKAKSGMKLRATAGLIACPAGTSVIDALAHLATYRSYDDDDDDEYNDDTDYKDEFGTN
ncbi:hypothetical protein QVD17_36601 [Tagetes erecta]|uniref:Uncharacterized protein n=1 Tax=Tagetes erecta TaxID=13708 RepID=A0AAD8JUK0_TARER|nr:hypothetical protein QVD17_36601 [Tagetes erecta]